MIPITPPRWPQIGPSALLRRPWRGVYVPPSTGTPSYSRTFNGTNQYFSIADNADFSLGDVDATFFGWFYVLAADNTWLKAIFGKGDPYSSGGEYFAWLQNDVITWVARLADNSGYALQQFGHVTYPFDQWFSVELTHDKTNNRLNAYINGSVDLAAPTIAGGIYDSTNAFWVGRNENYGYGKHRMARFGFWKRLLSVDERSWLNAAARRFADLGQPGNDGAALLTDLVSYYDCEEESGDLTDDNNGNDLAANNSPGRASGP